MLRNLEINMKKFFLYAFALTFFINPITSAQYATNKSNDFRPHKRNNKLLKLDDFVISKEKSLGEKITEYKKTIDSVIKQWSDFEKTHTLSNNSVYKSYLSIYFFDELLKDLNNEYNANIKAEFTNDEIESIKKNNNVLKNIIETKTDNLKSKFTVHIQSYYSKKYGGR